MNTNDKASQKKNRKKIRISLIITAVVLAIIIPTTIILANDSYVFKWNGHLDYGEGLNVTTGLFTMQKTEGTSEPNQLAYCCDLLTHADKDVMYARTDIEDGTYYSNADAAHIRAILFNSYPYRDLDWVKSHSGVSDITLKQVISATQWAIWNYANGGAPDVHSTVQGAPDDPVTRLKTWLVGLDGIGASSPVADVNVDTDILSYNDTNNTVNMKITYWTTGQNVGGSPVALTWATDKNLQNEYGATVTDNGLADGKYSITIANLPRTASFTFTASGNQTVAFGGYLYSPEGGRTASQTYVGPFSGSTPVSNQVTYSGFSGSIRIKKVIDSNTTEDPTFTVHIEGGPEGTISRDISLKASDGEVTVSGLPYGSGEGYSYTVTEAAANGYRNLSISPETFKLNYNNKNGTILVTLTNQKLGKITITKQLTAECTNNPEKTFGFKVTYPDGSNHNINIEAGETETLDGLLYGNYTIEEKTIPEGYEFVQFLNYPAGQKTITVNLSNQTPGSAIALTAKNRPLGNLEITKKDLSGQNNLAGAEFDMSLSPDFASKIHVGPSGSDGKILSPYISAGTWYVKETKAPNGYILNTDVQQVAVTEGQKATLEFRNARDAGNLDILKTNPAGTPLAGAEFKLTKGSTVKTGYISGADGYIHVTDLDSGTWTVTETKAPDGYRIDTASKTVTIAYNTTASVTFTNTKDVGSLDILKKSTTGTPLAGAEFSLTKGATVLTGKVTGADGHILVADLAPGTWTVTETKAPEGYRIDTASKTVTIAFNTTANVEFTDTRDVGNLDILKKDASGAPLSGAEFKLTKGAVEKTGYISGADGYIHVTELDAGTWTVTETKAPTGYRIDTASKQVTIVFGQTASVEFTNSRDVGNLDILKTNPTGTPLAGAEFKLTKGSTVKTGYISGADGYIHVTGLDSGTWTVTETKAPDGYLIDTASKTVTIAYNTTASVTFTDTRDVGNLDILKTNPTGLPLSGAEFKLTKGAVVLTGYVTDDDGYIHVTGLDSGTWTVTETKAPENYRIDTASKQVTISYGTTASVTFTDTIDTGNLDILKTDASGAPLAGAEFSLTKGPLTINGYVTDETGYIHVNGLISGTWTVTETKAPEGYIIDTTSKTVTVAFGQTASVTFTNTRDTGNLDILKTNPTGTPLAGAEFKLTKGDTELSGYVTDDEGYIHVTGLDSGTWTVTETKAPEGYLIDTASKNVTISYNTTASVTFTDTRDIGGLNILKTDTAGTPLAGAEFKLTKGDVEKTGYITDATGYIRVTGLDSGTWTVTETKAPEGYIIDTASKQVTVSYGTTASVTFTDTRDAGNLDILKTNTTGTPLSGAEFRLTKGDIVKTGYVSGADGYIHVTGLDSGVWTVTETKAPAGYVIDTASKQVTVSYGTTASVTFTDSRDVGNLNILKTNPTGTPLAGAEFRLTKGTNVLTGYISGADGYIRVTGLDSGTWTVTETKAPEGYIIDTTSKTVTVSYGTTASVTFTNTRDTGNLDILKTNPTGTPLAGAEFKLTKGAVEKTGYISGADGYIHVTGLDSGVWTVTETKAPEGYLIDTASKTVTIAYNTTASVTFTDTRDIGNLDILKTNPAGIPLAGAEFKLTKGDVEKTGYITDATGYIHVTGLDSGTWLVTETKAPEGYLIDTASKNVTVSYGTTASVTFTNSPDVGGLRIVKVDAATHENIAGATFAIYRDEALTQLVQNVSITDVNGVTLENIPNGIYWIIETQAPTDYIKDNAKKQVEVKLNETATVTFTNQPIGNMRLMKVDYNTGEPLTNATFEIYADEACTILKETVTVTDAAGALLEGLNTGYYWVKETVAPDGYLLDPVVHRVTVERGREAIFTSRDLPETYDLTLIKIDGYTLAPLAGAEISLYSDSALTHLVSSGTSDSTGKIIYTGLLPGTYWALETKAPEGYKLNAVKVEVHVVANSDNEFKITNALDDEEEYQTGTDDYNLLIAGGALLVAGGGVLTFVLLRRRHRARHAK